MLYGHNTPLMAQAFGLLRMQGSKDWSGGCAAVFDGEAARVVENEQGQRSTPSVVAFQERAAMCSPSHV